MENQVTELAQAWATADRRDDTDFLAQNVVDDFIAGGPRGFMLSKIPWLARDQSGSLRHASFVLDEMAVRVYGDAAAATGHQTQARTFQGRGIAGQTRVTQVLVRQERHWLLAALHLSTITDAPAGGR